MPSAKIDHKCEICNRNISADEAAYVSKVIRSKCPTKESPYFWDVWTHDFCINCMDRKFNTWNDFVNHINLIRNEN